MASATDLIELTVIGEHVEAETDEVNDSSTEVGAAFRVLLLAEMTNLSTGVSQVWGGR